MRGLVIGVYGSGGAPWHHLALAAVHGAEVRPVRAEDITAGRLAELDALVMPGGGALAMTGMLRPLGDAGAAAIRSWVEAGGCYVSSCAGSVLPLALEPATEALLAGSHALRMTDATLANPGDATLGGLASPGVGEIRVRLDSTHPFASGLPDELTLMHYNGPLFDASSARNARPFVWPVAAEPRFTPAERFLPGEIASGTTLDRSIADGAATGMDLSVGRGRAILFGSHPEFGLGPLLLGWGMGAELLVRALACSSNPVRRSAKKLDNGWNVAGETQDGSTADLAYAAAHDLERLAKTFEGLVERNLGAWLHHDHAASFHGRSAADAWREDTAAAARLAGDASASLNALAPRLTERDRGWLDDAVRSDQDFGAMGLRQLLKRIGAMLAQAEVRASAPAKRPAHAYDLFDEHPFHLAVGSYLSAAGLVAAAALLIAILSSQHEDHSSRLNARLWLSSDDLESDGA